MDNDNNIELRSEKVRNIIGQIPPQIIRTGASVFIIIFFFLGLILYNYRFPSKIKGKATLWYSNDSIRYSILIPIHQAKSLNTNQIITFRLINNEAIDAVKLNSSYTSIDSRVILSKSGSFKMISGKFKQNGVFIMDTINAEATIFGDSINVIQWILIK